MPDGPMPESASPPRLLQEFIDRAAAEPSKLGDAYGALVEATGGDPFDGPSVENWRLISASVGSDFVDRVQTALREIAPLGVQLVPEPMLRTTLRDHEFLLVRYRGLDGSRLAKPLFDEQPLEPGAVPSAIEQVERLAAAGWWHRFMDRGYGHWRVARPAGRLVVTGWRTELRRHHPSALQQRMSRTRRLLRELEQRMGVTDAPSGGQAEEPE